MRRTLAFLLFLVATLQIPAQSPVSVSIGHPSAVSAVATAAEHSLAFTGASDGSLRVWNLEDASLRTARQMGSLPIVALVLHPDGEDLAVVQSDGVQSHLITVVEWRSGEVRYTIQPAARPIYVGYSPAGSYLVYSLPSFRSLHFHESESGTERTYLDAGFGIVAFVQMTASERYIMSYIPSRGQIVYHELQTGGERHRASTASGLSHIVALDNQHFAGTDGESLIVVNNYTGEVEAERPIGTVRSIATDGQGLTILTSSAGGAAISRYSFTGSSLRDDGYRAIGLETDAILLATAQSGDGSADRGYLVGSRSGVVSYYDRGAGRKTEVGPRPTVPIDRIAWSDGRLHILAGAEIVSIVSDFLDAEVDPNRAVRFVRSSIIEELPVDSVSGISATPEAIYAWGPFEDRSGLFRISPSSGRATLEYETESRAPILTAKVTERSPLLLHRDGRIIQLSETSLIPQFEYTAIGAQDVVLSQSQGIVVAKSRSTTFDSSVVRINPRTQETVAVRSPAFLSTRLMATEEDVYSIGLVRHDGATHTHLLRHSGTHLQQTEEMLKVNGERPGADIAYHPDSETLFTSLSDSGVIALRRARESSLSAGEKRSQQLLVVGDLLFATNTDGSISVWDVGSYERLFDFYLFPRGRWLAINPRGSFLASHTSIERYLKYVPTGSARRTLSSFRLSLPISVESTSR